LANNLLYKVADYLDSINTFGSGEKWVINFYNKVKNMHDQQSTLCVGIKFMLLQDSVVWQ
jgi:hypothetical protein